MTLRPSFAKGSHSRLMECVSWRSSSGHAGPLPTHRFSRPPYIVLMTPEIGESAWHDAVDARDPSFDGVFYVAITSTRIYCRPVCPSRIARRENRRFFATRDDAEAAGFRACRRCRPELKAGNTPLEVVPRLAQQIVAQIAEGALNGRTIQSLALSMGKSDRHVRRAFKREVGASPFRVVEANRLRTAAELLVDTRLPITQIAYTSGYQSLRRFNAAFRQRFEMSPTEWRKAQRG